MTIVEVFLVLMLSFGIAHLSSTMAVNFDDSFEYSISLRRLRGLSYCLVGFESLGRLRCSLRLFDLC
ncbi:hypothetical protein GIB67_039840 [Kingdonia uniflora]|uniref:Uncharacterized protein n=1 Tax=Kingdonia uniflora TaxID=39325 RepID=A0A7J7P364_9MAGN|nr:hypothetical protein GIB67_039840 [Kingdonia uniflora]